MAGDRPRRGPAMFTGADGCGPGAPGAEAPGRVSSDMWSGWCRLCAREPAPVPLAGAEGRVAKYLGIPNQVEVQPNYPTTICQDCSDILSSFDTYALQCEKVQLLFRDLLGRKEPFADAASCRSFRDSYMEYSSIDYHKLIPLCSIKDEDELPNGAIGNSLLKEILLDKNSKLHSKSAFKIKDENDQELFEDSFSNDDSADDIDDEEDHIPLSSISTMQLGHKRKSKKLKLLPKAKRKKISKSRLKIEDETLVDEDVDIKTEPLSDEDINKIGDIVDNKGEKKKKRERQIINDSIISFTCYICRENCNNWHALCRHFTDVHKARAEVQCCCGKYLASRVSISRHCASHGKINSFDCTKCTKKFPRATELETHMITHLPKEEHPYVCCKCAKRFSTPQLLKHHERKHIPIKERSIHTCKFCKTKFASKSSLTMHIQTVHERLKNFVCDQCGSAFATKGILEEHLAMHSDIRAHVCTLCDKGFKTKQRLAIHLDTHNDTVYQCPHCPMQLNSRRTLRMHLYVHDNILRYQCTECDKAFRRAKDLKNHSNVHSGRRPYSCPWCSRTFANGSNCRAHKRRMHPNELRMFDEIQEKKHNIRGPETITDEIQTIPHPKVIHATVKRKFEMGPVSEPSPPPPFGYKPEKLEIIDERPKFKEDPKKEGSSPAYESSLSPLNLNARLVNGSKTHQTPQFTITPMTGFDLVPGSYQDGSGYSPLPITIIQKKEEYQDVQQEQQKMFAGYGEANMQNVYGSNPGVNMNFPQYEIHEVDYDRN